MADVPFQQVSIQSLDTAALFWKLGPDHPQQHAARPRQQGVEKPEYHRLVLAAAVDVDARGVSPIGHEARFEISGFPDFVGEDGRFVVRVDEAVCMRVEVRIRSTESHEFLVVANLQGDILGGHEVVELGLENADQIGDDRTGETEEAERLGAAGALDHAELAAMP